MSDGLSDLAQASTAWLDQWWDAERRLLWNPPGSFTELGPARSLHLVPQSGWYAVGLLARGQDDDHDRAAATIAALLDLQYDEPGTVWHGTFARFAETPHPQPGAQEWVDYDPNWRQFIGTTFVLVLQELGAALPPKLVAGMQRAVELAVTGEPEGRVPAWYSNIALMKAWLDVEAGDRSRGHALAREVADHFGEHGSFAEYNSATYYGVDLYALALWKRSSSIELVATGAAMEGALWEDMLRWYHPGLRNLCGPYTRAYGMDMSVYAAQLGMWMWEAWGREAAPFPDLSGPFDHSHDVSLGPVIGLLGAQAPPAPSPGEDLPRIVQQTIMSTPQRAATGWLGPDSMVGGESSEIGFGGWDQYVPATAHWRRPDGGVGWLRASAPGPVEAVASAGVLEVRAEEPITVVTNPADLTGEPVVVRHEPGLVRVEVELS